MQKVVLAILVCALFGYVAYNQRAAFLGAPKPVPGAAAKGAVPPAKAMAASPGGKTAPPAVVGASPVRAQIEPLLKPLKVTSIMLGEPSLVIINKKDYSVGDTLALPGAKDVKVAAIDEAGVTLSCRGENFHLDAPAAPDLDALRKKS